MKYDDLDKLNELKTKGAITESEFETEKAKLLKGDNGNAFWGMDEKTYAMVLHLSQLGSFLIPLSGLILPIVMWSVYKERSDFINQNGRHAINWLISCFIYMIVCIPLCFVIVGFFLLLVLCVLNIVFCIMAGIKASGGTTWRYPMSIRFL